jgi:hypothetical protein
MPCPVLSNRTANTSTIIGVFCGVLDKALEGTVKVICKAASQEHEAIKEMGIGGFSS